MTEDEAFEQLIGGEVGDLLAQLIERGVDPEHIVVALMLLRDEADQATQRALRIAQPVLEVGARLRWQPGLKMDPDTGNIVELLRAVAVEGPPYRAANKWRVRAVESSREFTVYADELRALRPGDKEGD